MFLRQLTLKGFKSFADPATLALEPGVTVVVGPNGSGKSNVVDAIAWVLGAQAPSAVRSQKMDDVIFAGTSKRPALGRAEVTLTIDNSSGILPIEFTEVTLRRTLFRSGDSEYAINGVPCRLLDMQELLSDAGVGRQQHVIVSQGQIDAVLNARPEDRRSIIEEAAGVLKFRKRKEKAERRLDATEGNLVRVQDLLREVRRQLRPLERQAEAARRHIELASELTALRIHLAGREIGGHRTRLEGLTGEARRLGADEARLRSELVRLDANVVAVEAELTSLGGFDLGDALVRAEQLRERARGLAALAAERRRGLARDHQQLLDTGLVASLEADGARTAAELAEVDTQAQRLGPDADELAAAEAGLAAERETLVAGASVGSDVAARAAADARSEIRALRAAVERAAAELERAGTRRDALSGKAERLAADEGQVAAEVAERVEAEAPLVAEVAASEAARVAAERAADAADEARRRADADHSAWQARAEALAQALDEARARAGAEQLAGVAGVLGTLLEMVEVDDGWEAAFEAAAGEALLAVVTDGTDAARRALATLSATSTPGAVISLSVNSLPETPAHSPFRSRVDQRGEWVRGHVRVAAGADPAVGGLLDRLLDGAVAVHGGWADAVDVALAEPDLVVVTLTGDRLGRYGWRLGAAGSGVTGAALDEATARARSAAHERAQAEAAATAARAALAAARDREAEARHRHVEASNALARSRERLARLRAEQPELAAEAEQLALPLAEVSSNAERDRARLAELELRFPALEAAEAAEQVAARAAAAARARWDDRAAAVAALRRDVEVRAAGLEQRRQLLEARRVDIEQRLAADVAARAEASERRLGVERALGAVDRLAALVAVHAATLDTELAELNERRRLQSEAARAVAARLEGLRHERSEADGELERVRERLRRVELDSAEVSMRLEAAVETLRRDLDTEPDAAIAAPCPELPEGQSANARARELERELRLLGPINPLALEEFTALQERHAFLEAQLDDVKNTRRELLRVIRAIDTEIQQTFAAAYADVSGHFTTLFTALFPGGSGRLILTQPDDLLNTGLEVEAKPSGKNVKKLSLLSGGERSLTALAFLFAVFRARPSPFYVMDEVEAALDDVNLHRFLALVAEFRDEAQLIIVSHQKRTMEAADCLFGVTMQPGGSSKVVSERIAAGA